MRKVNAAVLRAVGEPLTIEQLDLADPGAGEVRVRITAAGVCHSDLHYMTGDLSVRLPAVLGHEGVGVIEEVGIGVTAFAPGDHVIMTWRPSCGACRHCTTGRPALCALGAVHANTGGLIGGGTRFSAAGNPVHHLMGVACFAEQVVVSEKSVIRIPNDIPSEIAAIVGCAVVTGVGAVINRMTNITGKGVVVVGAGGVGLSAVMGLQLVGVNPVIVIDPVAERRQLAFELGATHVIDASDDDVAEQVEAVAPGGVCWALDAVGLPSSLAQAFEVLSPRGTVVAVGLGRVGATVSVPINPLVQQEKGLIGSLYGSSNPSIQIPELLELHRNGRLPLERLVGRQFGLDDINDAFDSLSSGGVGRAIIKL